MPLTQKEQLLLIKALENPLSSKNQKIYKQRVSFYNAVWKLRNIGLLANTTIKINGIKIKLWKPTLDGIIIARILSKLPEQRGIKR
jgi:hypothetical protein